jgi:hypothetical protein
MDEFTAWMAGLDVVEVAKTNSFHSEAHRLMVANHQKRKTVVQADPYRWRQEMTDLRRASFARNALIYEMNRLEKTA